jgi:hypothetical protein
MRDVFLNWQIGSNFGWGLLGLNLFAQWANDAHVRPLMGYPDLGGRTRLQRMPKASWGP